MRKIYLLLLLVTTITFSTTDVFAYGVTGHRVVAEIAQRHLTKKAKKALKKIIGDQQLAFWANWPDFIKSDTTGVWKKASRWHYVDFPGHVSKVEFETLLQKDTSDNLYTKIKYFSAELRQKNVPLQEQQYALYFLIHFVGDLHQPLHVGRDEDQGGNKIRVQWFGRSTNLHALWDEAMVDFQQYSYTEYATVLDVASKDAEDQMTNSTLEDWFYESHVLSDKIYDLTRPNTNLSYSYNYLFVSDLNSELLKGGLRLAKMLNEILG